MSCAPPRCRSTLKEYLTLLEAMDKGVVSGAGGNEVQDFYYLSRAALVKDEKHLDRFDKVFGHVFKGLDSFSDGVDVHQFPEEWLKKLSEKFLTEEEKKQIEAMGGWDKLMETLKQRMEEQKKRHEGGNKMIGTAGTSPYGAYGYNPEGVRIGQKESRHQRAVKVWDKREFKNLDDSVEIGTRNPESGAAPAAQVGARWGRGRTRSRRHGAASRRAKDISTSSCGPSGAMR